MNDFFLVKAFALSDKLDGAIISAINDLMNHECIKGLSMKISIEFKDQVSRFYSKGYSESQILIQVRGGGGGVTSKIQMYIFTVSSPCNRPTVVGIESVQHLPYQSM